MSFDYPTVKSLLQDAALFPESDMENAFFRKGASDAASLFAYVQAYGAGAAGAVADMVFADTESLLHSARCDAFVSYWLTRYNDFGMQYLGRIARQDEGRYFPTMITAMTDGYGSIQKRADCFSDLAKTYESILSEHKNAIKLYTFLTNTVLFYRCIRTLESDAGTDGDVFQAGVRMIDEIAYPMIRRYRKQCCGYEQTLVEALNEVMEDASVRLFGKQCWKKLEPAADGTASQDTTVALCTMRTQAAKKKKIWCALAVGAAVILILLVIIFGVKK